MCLGPPLAASYQGQKPSGKQLIAEEISAHLLQQLLRSCVADFSGKRRGKCQEVSIHNVASTLTWLQPLHNQT